MKSPIYWKMADNGFVLELTEDWVKPENPYDELLQREDDKF